MELAPYLYEEYGYRVIFNSLKSLNYEFYDLKDLNKITNINHVITQFKDGSSKNILLM